MEIKERYLEIMKNRIGANSKIINKDGKIRGVEDWVNKSEIFAETEEVEFDWEMYRVENIVSEFSCETIVPDCVGEDIGREERILGWIDHYSHEEPVFDDKDEDRGEFGRTELHKACEEGDLEKVKRLLDKGANPNLEDNNGYDSVSLSIIEGHDDIIEEFERSGIVV